MRFIFTQHRDKKKNDSRINKDSANASIYGEYNKRVNHQTTLLNNILDASVKW